MWATALYFLNGDGQRDTIYLGYHPNSWASSSFQNNPDTIFGEWPTPVNGSFAAGFYRAWTNPDTVMKVFILPELKLEGEWYDLYLLNGVWPVTIAFDTLPFYDTDIPYPDSLSPEAYIEITCVDIPPYPGNCRLLEQVSWYLSDDPDNIFPSLPPAPPPPNTSRVVSDSLVWIGDWLNPPDDLVITFALRPYPPSVGIVEHSTQSQLDIYPNPTTGVFTVTGQRPVQVFDLLGREIATSRSRELGRTRNDGIVVDLSGYPGGIYFVRVGEQVQKVVLSK